MIEIDGSYGEGGGQILRNAAAYAALFRQSTRISNIRAKRSKPGMRPQHVTALQLLAKSCGGTLEGGHVGSQEVIFHVPRSQVGSKKPEPPTLTGDTRTAGSICLLLQAALPYALFAPSGIQWILRGGTNAPMAPQYDYWDFVFRPTLCLRMEIPEETIQSTVYRRGFYPRGGGEVRVHTKPLEKPLQPITLTERGELENIRIRAFHAGKCPKSVASRTAQAAKLHLEKLPTAKISIEIIYEEPALGSASGVLIVASTSTGCIFGGSALGSPKVDPVDVGLTAARELCSSLVNGGCVDEYLQDQLICYMALADGVSEVLVGSLELHTTTAIWLAEKCSAARFEIKSLESANTSSPDANGKIPGKHLIRCHGVGFAGETSTKLVCGDANRATNTKRTYQEISAGK